MNLWAGLKGLFGAGGATKTLETALGTVDKLHTSAEERGALRSSIVTGWIAAQARVIEAEARAGGLTAAWRPITSLALVGILVWHVLASSFGLPPPDWTGIPDRLWDTILYCLGGYIGGRTLEKIVAAVVPAKK